MMSHALEEDVACGYTEIQGRVNGVHARSATLRSEGDTLAARAKELETKVAELEGERRILREEVQTLRSIRGDLETEIEAERELSQSMAHTMWGRWRP